MLKILVLYFSRNGGTQALANKIAQGIEQSGCEAVLRTVPPVSDNLEKVQSSVPSEGDPYVSLNDLNECDGLALGSPTRFGNMAGALKHFLDKTSAQWLSGALEGKPAVVFTSTGSIHGGQETTLMSMMIPLFHHGMIVMGLPYSEPDLHTTRTGGTPYGVTHLSDQDKPDQLSDEESRLALAQGQRLASIALKLRAK